MFRTQDLPMIADFFLMFHKDKPIDWLLDHILWVKVCNPEKNEVSQWRSKITALEKQKTKNKKRQHSHQDGDEDLFLIELH